MITCARVVDGTCLLPLLLLPMDQCFPFFLTPVKHFAELGEFLFSCVDLLGLSIKIGDRHVQHTNHISMFCVGGILMPHCDADGAFCCCSSDFLICELLSLKKKREPGKNGDAGHCDLAVEPPPLAPSIAEGFPNPLAPHVRCGGQKVEGQVRQPSVAEIGM